MKIYAHRGLSHKYPEGSRSAYQGAIDVGADGLECDIRLTRDRVPICFHDRTTTRITGKKGFVGRLTLAEMRNRYEIITLEELLDLAISSRSDLLIETKHPTLRGGNVERAVIEEIKLRSEAIAKSGIDVTVMSFSLLAVLRILHSGLSAGYVIKRRWRLWYLPTKRIALDIELARKNRRVLERLHDKEVFIWTANSDDEISFVKGSGVAGLITDRADKAKKLDL